VQAPATTRTAAVVLLIPRATISAFHRFSLCCGPCRVRFADLLTDRLTLCYGARLGHSNQTGTEPGTRSTFLRNIVHHICHAFCLILLGVTFLVPQAATAQIYRPALPSPPPDTSLSPNVNQPVHSSRTSAPDSEHVFIEAVTQEVDGPLRHLRGMVRIETTEMQLKADEVDYNSDTGDVEARGHVHFEHFERGEKLDCDRAEYNIEAETGKFYVVKGTATARVNARPGLLITQNPFYFEGNWAERLKDHYILHDGFLTDCVLPRPWWRLKAPTFDVVPGERAIARHAKFYLGRVPILYVPVFYKSLEKEPRKSGFLVPNVGNSSTRGRVLGVGYYWAINRSFDMTYRARYFSIAGLSHHVDFRGDLGPNSGFDFFVDGIKDQRQLQPSASGARVALHAKFELGKGWYARGELNYLTSFAFRQNYTESYNEAVSSETHSIGFVEKHFSDFDVFLVSQRNVNFQSTVPGDDITIRKLPEVEFHAGTLPFWVSFQSSAGLLRRGQSLFQTRQFVSRLDFEPTVTTAFHWKGVQLIPSFAVRETAYGSSVQSNGAFSGQNVLRSSSEFSADLLLPSVERVFNAPAWLGSKMKHVIEPRVTYKKVAGIDDFAKIIRFDESDILANTHQVEFSLTNRLFLKDRNGIVSDFVSWQVLYDRYFDPTFGGALVPGRRNVFRNVLDVTGFSFLDGERHSSPVASILRLQSRVGLEWRADYDPIRHHIVNSAITMDGRLGQVFFSASHNNLKTSPVLAPPANQVRGTIGYGADNRRGWSYAFTSIYDFRSSVLQYAQTQVTYNTDCCGLSIQYRRLDFGARNENQFRVAFAISNIGSFGTLKRQERIF
jgi:LPS-assembly protein